MEEIMIIYEKQNRETEQSYDTFKKYLEMGETRNLLAFSIEQNIPINTLRRKANKWNWEQRAEQYDLYRLNDTENSNSINDYTSDEPFREIIISTINTVHSIFVFLNRKLIIGDETINGLNFVQILKSMENLLKLNNELLKIIKTERNSSGQLDVQNQVNVFDKLQNNQNLFAKAQDLLSEIAGD